MKKSVLLLLFAGLFCIGYSQPKITNLAYPKDVKLFGLYEISFQLGTYDNPYDPSVIDVYAEMTDPEGHVYRVNGFYYEDYKFTNANRIEKYQPNPSNNGWRVRFTPQQTGKWTFAIHAKDRKGETVLHSIDKIKPSFNCIPVNQAKGFISRANSQYLKQEVVQNGQRTHHSFYPVGPNVAWYSCASYFDYTTPMGIYDYKRYCDSLKGNANYMRVWLTRYQYLSLYGPEFTQVVNGKRVVYFDNTLNQKDAAEFDHILQTAATYDISVMPCIFTFGDWNQGSKAIEEQPSDWRNNPFNSFLKHSPDFFTNKRAKAIAKNLLRYIVARWGYATNIVAWELWNEVNNMAHNNLSDKQFQTDVLKWHEEMASYLRSQDPYHHLVTTSMGGVTDMETLDGTIFRNLDISQMHNYQNIHKAASKEQFSHILYQLAKKKREQYPSTPAFTGEFGFGQTSSDKKYADHDPLGIDLHNSSWSSLFSGTMGPASFWFWDVLKNCGLFARTRPMLNFTKTLPILSGTFTGKHTGTVSKNTLTFPNNLETYYMINRSEDTLYGWSQDTAFCYQSLRRLANKTVVKSHFDLNAPTDHNGYVFTLDAKKRPKPSSNSNRIEIPISKQPVGTEYVVRWYDAETGYEMAQERTTATVTEDHHGNRQLAFQFPSSIRDLNSHRIHNTFGDAVFSITKKTAFSTTPKTTTEKVVTDKEKAVSDKEIASPVKKEVNVKKESDTKKEGGSKKVTPKSVKVKPN